MKSNFLRTASEFGIELLDNPVVAKGTFRRDDPTETLVIIDGRKLARECLVRSIEVSDPHIAVRGYSSLDEWRASPETQLPIAILLNIAARLVSDPTIGSEIARLASEVGPTPVVVLAESEDLREVISALDRGARGYIPASVGADVIVEATRLTSSGGVFLPAASILALRNTIAKAEPPPVIGEQLTCRQSAVASALRQGKSNKIIAYHLNMSESTVKIHVRNIMKKLKATNRTEAAFRLSLLSNADQKMEFVDRELHQLSVSK